ncbi:tyrosinase family protein [Streptomyces sp. MnatMP-M17]|uniref:tyrosinase family protein n=1 Tax=unclassified Streptomyces TaxID=2593676 RepID=UPI00081DDDAD|nr:tyrosinase family protein [Streptomyces sp. MnatMP-M17]MYZ36139.1 tyrosinase family protein [Streptomyces sp. SID4917]SCF81227.1 tyrosinase [Streptomyces sp. MnatMP-M17]
MYTRKNQRNLTSAERRGFVGAVLELKRNGEYDEFVRQHIEYYVIDGEDGLRAAHMTPSFFPWHRRFLLEFERALQRIDPKVTVPYWDWTTDNTPAAALWSEDFLGGNGRTRDHQVMTGPFAYETGQWTIRNGVTDRKYLMRNLGRPSAPISLPSHDELAWAMNEPVYDMEPWDSTAASGFRNRLEGWLSGGVERWRNHNRVHRWVGGHMLGASSPNDPVFWLHHSFVDLLWDRWQRRHPKAVYLPRTRLRPDDPQSGRVISLEEPMPPWDVKPSELLDHRDLYRYEQ